MGDRTSLGGNDTRISQLRHVTGLAIGLAAGNMEAGICLGLFAGTAAGILLDLADRKKRRRGKTAEKYRAARENAARELKDDTNNDGQPH